MDYFKEIYLNIGIGAIVDMAIVAFVFYKIYTLIKETRAEQLIKGIIVLLIATKVSEWFKLFTINWVLQKTMTVGVLALLIVFQPELRRGLEHIGRSGFITKPFVEIKKENFDSVIDEIVDAVASLSRQKIGALIVIERETGLNEVVETGRKINGIVSSELLINIFIPNTPLHDGAVIIKENILKAASCLLPLTENMDLNRELGTRHRAAIGVTENSDCVTIVVSEETGAISIADNGELLRYIDTNTLTHILRNIYEPNGHNGMKQGIILKWRHRHEKEEG